MKTIDADATIATLRANFQQAFWNGIDSPEYTVAEETILNSPTVDVTQEEKIKKIEETINVICEEAEKMFYNDKALKRDNVTKDAEIARLQTKLNALRKLNLIDADKLIAKIREKGVRGEGWSDTEREDYVIDIIEEMPIVSLTKLKGESIK